MSDSLRATARNSLGRLLSIVAVLLMVYGAFWPIFDRPIARGGQILAMIAAATTLASIVAPVGNHFALTFLWAAFGMACAFGTIGIFSAGFVYLYLIAAVLLLHAIAATTTARTWT